MIESTFNTGSVTLNYAAGAPSGPPLILLHGGSARWQSFNTILPELASRWQIYAPDLRGHASLAGLMGSIGCKITWPT